MIGDDKRNSVSGGFFGEYRQWAKNTIQPVVKNFPKKLARGEERRFEIRYHNTSDNVVMALETLITDLPEGVHFYLDDNYVTLLPGERKILQGSIQVTERAAVDLANFEFNLQVDGWNVLREARKLELQID